MTKIWTAGMAALALAGCALNPISPTVVQQQPGDACEMMILDEFQASPSARFEDYLAQIHQSLKPHQSNGIAYRLQGVSSRGPDQVITAGACQNGFMYMSEGLALLLGDEQEATWVTAHELGHVELGHFAQRDQMERSGAGPQALQAMHHRHEREADCFGLKVTGYPASVAISALTKMEQLQGPQSPDHPSLQARAESLHACELNL